MARNRNFYEPVAASQTDQKLGTAGGPGDHLERLIIVPATLSPGSVVLEDGAGSAITVFPGGTNSVNELKPFSIDIGASSRGGAWQVTTGADVSVIGIGEFTE